MPIFEIEQDGKTFDVDAPDMASAVAAVKKMGQPARTPDRPQGLSTLGEQIRAKYPNSSDRLMGEFDKFDAANRSANSDILGGLRASAASTVVGGGDVIRRGLGMERIVDKPEVRALTDAPDSTLGRGAKMAGDVAQFFIPVGGVGKVKTGLEMAKAGGLTLAQTGSPGQALASVALTGGIPAVSRAVANRAPALKRSAEKSMAQALGATKEWAKDTAAKVAPGMLARGVKGSREAMLAQARTMAKQVGSQLDDAYAAAASEGSAVPSAAIRDQLMNTAQALTVSDDAGRMRYIPGTERVIKRLSDLERFVGSMGDEIPVDKAAHIKRVWDQIVSKAGLFGPKAAASATDSADAWAIREGATAFRGLINANPTIEALNKEASFWVGLRKVLAETERRTQAQGGGLVSGITGAAGVASGFASGDSMSDRVQNAVIGGLLGRQLVKTVQSPAFRTTVSGPLKDRLARALASGRTSEIAGALTKISAAAPSVLAGRTPIGATR